MKETCIAPKKAKALDKPYEDLLTKICLKHEVPAELEIISHIKGMVYTALQDRRNEHYFHIAVTCKVGNAVWVRNSILLSKKDFLALKRMPYCAESCVFAAFHHDDYITQL